MFYNPKKRLLKFLFLNTTKTAWTRLCNLAGTEWELPEDDTLTLKHVGVINTEQYNKLSVKCVFVCSLYIHVSCSYFIPPWIVFSFFWLTGYVSSVLWSTWQLIRLTKMSLSESNKAII